MIRSRENRRVKATRRLRARKGAAVAAAEGVVLIEGPHLLEAALNAALELRFVLCTPDFEARHGALLDRVAPGVVSLADEALVHAEADSDSPRGLVAEAVLPDPSPEVLRAGVAWLVLDGVQDPGNVGALARAAEAFGAAGVALLPGCAHWRHPRAVRGSAGSLLRLPAVRGVDPGTLDEAWPEAQWLVLDGRGECELGDLPAVLSKRRPVVLGVGAEAHGPRHLLGPDVPFGARRRTVRIAMAEPVESLNVATAGAIAMHALKERLAPRT